MSHDRRPLEVPEENHDGRTLVLLGVAGATGLSILVAAVWGLVVLLGSETDSAPSTAPTTIAQADLNSVEAGEPAMPSAGTSPTEVAVDDQPAAATPDTSPAEPATSVAAAENPVAPETEAAPDEASTKTVAATSPPASADTAPTNETAAREEAARDTAAARPEVEPALDRPSIEAVADVANFVPTRAGDPLVYHWVPGEIHGYSIKLTAEQNGQQQTTTGNVELTVNPGRKSTGKDQEPEDAKPETGTGTAFVIRSDGWLITCAHVVQGASKVAITLGGTEYDAEVAAKDPDNDLALLRIKANGLTSVPLADSSGIKLGQDVRAVGFPLTMVLGEGVKITRGSLAGILEVDAGKRYQIDAAINPGNSGGPVVDERGAVIGVASSRLVGLELTRLGFCVPSELVSGFLEKHDVTAEGTPAEAPLDGPALAEAVSRGVGLVRVTIDPLKASGELFALATSGSFRTEQPRNVRGFMLPMIPNSSFDRGTVTVDTNGHCESFDSPEQLPFLAGPMALLTVHPLDQSGRDAWTVRERIKVVVQKRQNGPGGIPIPRIPRPRIPRPFGGPNIGSPFDPQVVKELEAVEVHQYRIKSDSDDLVVLEKTFSLTTLDDDTRPYFRISGTGEVTFSRKTGLIRKFTLDHRFEQNSETEQTRIPVRIEVEHETPEIVAQRRREAAVRLAELQFKQQQDAEAKSAQPPGEKLDALLEQILNPKDQLQKIRLPQTIAALEKVAVEPDRRAEVESVLLEQLADTNQQVAGAAASALRVWGSEASVEPLIARVGDGKEFAVVRGACETLATLGDKRAAEPLVKLLGNLSAQIAAKDALTRLGPLAEDAVLELLSENDHRKVQLACDILQKIGGEKSVKPLELIAGSDDFLRKTFAKRALDEVRKRAADAQVVAAAQKNAGAEGLTPQHIAVQRLLETLRNADSNAYTRHQTLTALGQQPRIDALQPEVESLLLNYVASDEKSLKHPALGALKTWASEKSVDPLLAVILDPEQTGLQPVAVEALKPIATKAIGDRIVEKHGDRPPTFALRQLIEQAGLSETGELALGQLATFDDDIERNFLIDLLGTIGSPASLPLLDNLSQSPKPTTRLYAATVAATKIRLRNGLPR